ncbi:hypothetical protein [Streptomyces sp. NBC_00859]|uniref:hypothetical protein n=1 Tax=Streptomyces sp. NBC_00859 TaxID=2903682 RepID=UPI00386F46BF|nr:hypothetical protein OG584_18405 [Streptomyces sp. NBC_00859]
MSYSIFMLRFVDGETVALDAERLRQVIEPYVVAGGPEEAFSQLRAADGGEADLYHESSRENGMPCVTATHFARGTMYGVLARLAAALGASVLPQGGGALIFHENDRRHLPAGLQGEALVVAPTAEALRAAIDAP